MPKNEPVFLAYAFIYLAALVLGARRRKSFPLASVLPVVLILGIGFTGLVYLIVPQSPVSTSGFVVPATEILFVLVYLAFIAVLLARRKPYPDDPEHFLRRKLRDISFKLFLFVFFPLVALRLIWGVSWHGLGFSLSNFSGQLVSAVILILLLGGFNLVAGGAAAPIRQRQFTGKQLMLGFGLAFVWNCIEAGLVEEFFFRSFLQNRLVGFLHSPLSGICAASLLFGLAHAPGIYLRKGNKYGPLGEQPTLFNSFLYSILALSPAGGFTGLLFWRTQSLLAPILVHGGLDAVAGTADFIRGIAFLNRAGKRERQPSLPQ